jgi:cytochrome d ubiquinol oxidase subunit II
MDLNTVWFILVGTLFTGYMVLDGFDLGTGALLLFVKSDRDRRVMLNAIGPVWNGNEVWLVTGGGALFAAFPEVYATVFSGFYDALMLLLGALIFRAAAIEFRSQRPEPGWRKMWDIAFALSSVASAMILGVAFGNFVWGIPLDAGHEFQGDFLDLLHPFALLGGVAAVALFVMHANVYLVLKTEGPLQEQLTRWMNVTVPAYLLFFAATNVATFFTCPHIIQAVGRRPVILLMIALVWLPLTFNILREVRKGRAGAAFVSSCAAIVLHALMIGVAAYPNLVFSTPDQANHMDIYNSSSTPKTLQFMFVVAMIAAPIILTYTITIYYVFRGKVVLNDESY